jgi:hypothetical protein
MIWKDKQDMCILTHLHKPPAQGNLYEECSIVHKLAADKDYSRHMGYIIKGDRIANICSISQGTLK